MRNSLERVSDLTQEPMDLLRWNRLRYTLWSPGYDLVVRRLDRLRRRSIVNLQLRPGQRVLIVGAGTGLDLPLLPDGLSVLATDLTPAMLDKARPRLRPGMQLQLMNAQQLELPDESFDAVILHLIVAIVPDPAACVREAARVVRRGGRIAIFDKFLPDDATPSFPRRLANVVTEALATGLNRRLADVIRGSGADLRIETDEWAWSGLFRIVRLRRVN